MAKTTKLTVQVIYTTRKAKLVEFEGRQGWLRNASVNEANEVNAATFAKSADKYAAEAAKAAAEAAKADAEAAAKAAQREWANNYHTLPAAVRETEKAVCVQFVMDLTDLERDRSVSIWLPKSQLRDGQVSGWMIESKLREAVSRGYRNAAWSVTIGEHVIYS